MRKSQFDGWCDGRTKNNIYEFASESAGLARDVAARATRDLMTKGTLKMKALPPRDGYKAGLDLVCLAGADENE